MLGTLYAGHVVCRARWPGSGRALVIHAKVEKMVPLLNSLFFEVKIPLLSNYCVKYYDYKL